ncbi:putative MFS transporter family protein, partial [Rhizodiscina lignyota]
KYAGEDARPTSQKELWGWYAYGLAAEVFAISGVGSFLPVTLEQSAREMGVLRSDHSVPCTAAKKDARSLLLPRADTSSTDNQCVIHIFGSEVNSASFAMYTFSVAVFFQAITLVSISAIADHGNYRKKLLLIFAWIGSASSMLFIFIVPQLYMMASVLVIIGVTCLGSSFVLLNSFLPLLVANHPSINTEPGRSGLDEESVGLATAGMPNDEPGTNEHVPNDDERFSRAFRSPSASAYAEAEKAAPELQLSNQISAKGVGIGYISAVSVQIVSIGILILFSKMAPSISKTTFPVRLILFLVGAWWACFTVPTALWLRPRPGPPLASQRSNVWYKTIFIYIAFAWMSLWRTMKIAAKLKQAFRFLIAWFLLSDAIATIQGTAILFARTELQMETAAVALISILATGGGIAGAACWPIISRRFRWNANHTVIACLLVFEVIPVYGSLGFLPFIKAWGVGGIQQPYEIFPLAFIHGFAMGGISSYCRSLFGIFIPPGSEAAFYALYAFTDKGSSILGPAIVGRIVDTTGSIRSSFPFLAVLNLTPLPLIWMMNTDSGRSDALEMA